VGELITKRNDSSTGSNDCFVVVLVVLVLVVGIFILKSFKSKSLFVPCYGTFCAVLWHIMCRPVAHFVPSCGTSLKKSFCAVLWHILCRPVAHFVASRGT
jgi:hypothetical protein